MNRSLALISITLFLISCSAERQDTKQHQLNPLAEETSEINQRSTAINDGQAKASSTLSEDSNLAKKSIQKMFCLDQDISNWYGFKEQDGEQAQCKLIKAYKVTNYQCEMRLAFEEGFEAMFVLAPNATIISYSALDKCNAAKEIWESNGP